MMATIPPSWGDFNVDFPAAVTHILMLQTDRASMTFRASKWWWLPGALTALAGMLFAVTAIVSGNAKFWAPIAVVLLSIAALTVLWQSAESQSAPLRVRTEVDRSLSAK